MQAAFFIFNVWNFEVLELILILKIHCIQECEFAVEILTEGICIFIMYSSDKSDQFGGEYFYRPLYLCVININK